MIRPCLLAALSCASCASFGRTVARERTQEQARTEVATQATVTVATQAKATERGKSTRTIRTPSPAGDVVDVTVMEWGVESAASTTATATGSARAEATKKTSGDVVTTTRPWWAPVVWWALGAGALGALAWWGYKRIAGGLWP